MEYKEIENLSTEKMIDLLNDGAEISATEGRRMVSIVLKRLYKMIQDLDAK